MAMANGRNRADAVMECQIVPTRHLAENSQITKCRNTGAKLSTVNKASMKQIAPAIFPFAMPR